ncbi:hypothetical protein R1sor_005589 [Riccia sorocarpa]|uniref:Myb-like domain-containing protein n=1 Tax=Riccia sorocarpa TaxID=122646 RepID=A0ABD3HJY4_9MARC
MADAKDILGLPKVAVGSGGDKRRSSKTAAEKKPDGVSREVYALIGGLPPVMPALDQSSLKKKKAADSAKKVAWKWRVFTSSARADNLQLSHWERVVDGVEPSGDYAFAKYNKAVDVVRYTEEEYAKYLNNSSWSKEETDQLFDFCEQFDLRFIIIADRMPTSRTVEELKERYYSAARAIVLSRTGPAEDVTDHPLVKETYSIQYETERKKALGVLLSQSRQKEREDAEILAEAKRITEARLATKKAEEAELLSKSATATTTTTEATNKSPTTPARPPSPAQTAQAGPSIAVTVPSAPVVSGSKTGTSPAAFGPRPPRVYLRSAYLGQVVQVSTTQAGVRATKRVEQLLEEHGCRPKVKCPTKRVCEEHMELRRELLALLQLEKQVTWKENEVSVLRENPYADLSTPSTPKRAHRGSDHERVLTRATAVGAETDSFSGERVGKRDHKRKAPARFSEAPPSPHQKRSRKMKASDM